MTVLSIHSDDKNNNQTDELRELFLETEKNTAENSEGEQSAYQVDLREIDILNLPPRKEVHTSNSRTKLKVSRPFLRLLFISLLVIIILVVSYFLFDGELVTLLRE